MTPAVARTELIGKDRDIEDAPVSYTINGGIGYGKFVIRSVIS
jgi:hypothetical protein